MIKSQILEDQPMLLTISLTTIPSSIFSILSSLERAQHLPLCLPPCLTVFTESLLLATEDATSKKNTPCLMRLTFRWWESEWAGKLLIWTMEENEAYLFMTYSERSLNWEKEILFLFQMVHNDSVHFFLLKLKNMDHNPTGCWINIINLESGNHKRKE